MSTLRIHSASRLLTVLAAGLLLFGTAQVASADAAEDLIRKASKALQAGKPKEALTSLNAALELTPNDVDLYAMRARANDAAGNFDAAIADANKYIEKKPDETEGFLLRAKIYVAEEKYEQALADANKAINMAPKEPDGYYRRADIYRDMGKKDLSKADEKKAEELEKASRR